MITPILKDPKSHGGTLYTFPSASRDLTRAFSSSEYEFAFSHFACLNLPDFRYGTFEKNDLKGIFLDGLHANSIDSLNNLNTSLKWHIQSYMMNFEVAILNDIASNQEVLESDILKTPSERIFFNWLQKVNGIKIEGNREVIDDYGNEADGVIGYDDTLVSESELENLSVEDRNKTYRIGNKIYTWKGGQWRGRVLVSKTVQYIGNIDMVNNVNIDSDSFNEVYLNIPAGVGGSTKVFFDNTFEGDYYDKGRVINVDSDYIIGRNPEELSMSNNITLEAIYNNGRHYVIEDGYCINFNDSKYSEYGGLEDMNLESEEDFEFNCVLIYYRIKKGNGSWYTNLYGVLFLEEVLTSDYNINVNEDDERAGYIQRYPKFKNGNSWGLKLDLKIDAQPDSQLELRDSIYDDPNGGGVGMQMFTEALIQLNDCVKLFYEVKKENTNIEERLGTIENMISGIDGVYDLRDSVVNLRERVETFQPSIESFGWRMDGLESRITKLETNLSYLISIVNDLKKGGQN